MSGTILVAPTRHFAVVRASGDFEIRGVEPGRWRLHTWCDRLPGLTRDIEVQPGSTAAVELSIGPAQP
jgi:hypothetical protein